MLRLSFISVAHGHGGHRYDRGSVSIASGPFCKVLSSNVNFCLPAQEGEKQADDKCM